MTTADASQAQPAPDALEDTGERMVPEYHRGNLIYAEHVTRYRSALPVVEGKVALDIACGSGYGTQLLASRAAHVFGVDRDEDAVAYAARTYGAANVEYKVGDATAIPLPDDSVDVVVTFETIEHIDDYRAFMDEIKRVLKPDGVALISTPNDLEFAEGNHFHLHEFTYQELLDLVGEYFTEVRSHFQATWKYVAIGSVEAFTTDGPLNLPTENLAPLSPDAFLYFYLVCSNVAIERSIDELAAVGEHYSERGVVEHEAVTHGAITNLRAEESRLREQVGQLEAVNAWLVQERDQVRGRLDAINAHPAMRAARGTRRLVRRVTKRS